MYKKLLFGEITKKIWVLLRFLLLVGFCFVILYPIIYMLSMSFRDSKDLMDPSVIWVTRNFTFKNFKDAFEGMKYLKSLSTTITIGLVSSLLQTISCCFVAYGFARFKFKERGLMFTFLLLTVIIPPQVTLIPLYLLYKNFGIPFLSGILQDITGYVMTANLIDNPLAFYLPAIFGMGIRSGLYIFILRQFFIGFPDELEQAAEIDGCNSFSTFVRVILPNAGSMLLTVSLFSIVWYWNDTFYTSTFLGQSKTLAIALSVLRSALAESEGMTNNFYESTAQMQAGCLIFILPLLILYIVMQRYFTEGIERSGLVG